MTQEEFMSLKKGDQVLYNGAYNRLYGINSDHLLTRSECWMDDDNSASFIYVIEGCDQCHYFTADSIKFKE